jgi:hypothetical protein
MQVDFDVSSGGSIHKPGLRARGRERRRNEGERLMPALWASHVSSLEDIRDVEGNLAFHEDPSEFVHMLSMILIHAQE